MRHVVLCLLRLASFGVALPEGYIHFVFDFEADAHTRVSHGAWERISGAAADEITLRWNREAYDHIRLKPRILVDVSKLDTRVKLFGQELPFPILLAPTGGQKFIHSEGELAAARGAAAAAATSSAAALRCGWKTSRGPRPVRSGSSFMCRRIGDLPETWCSAPKIRDAAHSA